MRTDCDSLHDAQLLVDGFIAHHGATAIPSLIAACVGWSIRHGAPGTMRASLSNAIEMTHDAERAWKKAVS